MRISPRCPKARAMSGSGAGPLRRRGKALEAAIFEATLEQLTSCGYARLTMEGVAGAAQTGKAALYRRWASKEQLVLDALDTSLPPAADIPDRGAVRTELEELLQGLYEAVQSPAGCAVRALMGEVDGEPARTFMAFLGARVLAPAKESVMVILGRGAARGEVRPAAVTPLVADVAPALLLYRMKLSGGTLPAGFPAEIVDTVLMPMVRR